MTQEDPFRRWDGQRWMRWDGRGWVPEAWEQQPGPAGLTPPPYANGQSSRPAPSVPGWVPDRLGAVWSWATRNKKAAIIGASVCVFLVMGAIGSATHSTPAATTQSVDADSSLRGAENTESAGPTATSESTAPQPTPAPVRPAPTTRPAPTPTKAPLRVKFSGKGDKILRLKGELQTAPVIVSFTHHGSANFIVSPLDATGTEGSALVNVIGSYSGVVPMNLADDDETAGLKIEADGRWTATIRALSDAPRWDGAKTLSARGDQVFIIADAVDSTTMNSVTLTHRGSANFIVDVYGKDSGDTNIVNEIGHYSGQQVLPTDAALLVVQADGPWTMTKD